MKIVTARPNFQGDIMLIKVNEIPADAIKQEPDGKYFILAHSEQGYHHVIDRTRAEVFAPADDRFTAYIRALEDVEIKHLKSFDRHESYMLKKGDVARVNRQVEYFPEGDRLAAD